jgi:hypothetical protein
MNFFRLAPWLSFFAALLLLMQSLWLLHLAFVVGGQILRPLIYGSVISVPLVIFARAGWRLMNGHAAGINDAVIGAVCSLVIGFALMLIGPIASLTTAFTMFFCFLSAVAGFASVMLAKHGARSSSGLLESQSDSTKPDKDDRSC